MSTPPSSPAPGQVASAGGPLSLSREVGGSGWGLGLESETLGLRFGALVFPHVEDRRGKPLGAETSRQRPARASISQTYLRAGPIGCGL